MRNMNSDAAKQFGEQIRHIREEQNMSMRGLASRSGVDSASLTRLEHGQIGRPQPETLKRLAEALGVPLADLFAIAGYVTPQDLPSLAYYLRVKYGHLPRGACEQIEGDVRRLIDEHRTTKGTAEPDRSF